MREPRDGGAAFPRLYDHCQRVRESEYEPGLSIRDYFAATALQGFLASDVAAGPAGKAEDYAREAYEFADAMLAERQKAAQA